MRVSLDLLVKLLAGVIGTVAITLALLALLAAQRMGRATDHLLLSQSQLESALRLRAAPHIAGEDSTAVLAHYGDQIAAEDRLASGAAEHRHQAIERGDLERLRRIFGTSPRDEAALDALTRHIVARESDEVADSRRALAASQHLVRLAASLIGLVLLGTGATAVSLLRTAILKPIRLLVAAVERFGADGTVASGGAPMPREFDLLATSFAAMAKHIGAQHEALAHANERLAERVVDRTRALAGALGLDLDRDMRMLSCDGRHAALTERECELLALLLERTGRTVTRDQVLVAAWQTGGEGSDNLVDVYIGYLRRKLRQIGAPWEIRAVRGAGFVLLRREPELDARRMEMLERVKGIEPSS
jgi:DNA-binding winged helix-turn-helix (wHTH) protein